MNTKTEVIKKYYQKGIYKKSNIDYMLKVGAITQEEYSYIVR